MWAAQQLALQLPIRRLMRPGWAAWGPVTLLWMSLAPPALPMPATQIQHSSSGANSSSSSKVKDNRLSPSSPSSISNNSSRSTS